ncbi:MAG: FHA domain-containing protein [Firmicutes bacterium]|mgnify:CR=1 FL=1|nr:FHA domain-containing protein [Bacillota bacterium]
MNDPRLTATEELNTAELTEEMQATPEEAICLPPQQAIERLSEGYPCFISIAGGTVTPVKTKIFVAGFSPRCDLVIPQDPAAHTVSRFHATVTAAADGRLYIKDESLNGTWFGTDPADPASFVRIPKGNDVELKHGRYVRFATVLYLFQQGERQPQ